MLGNQIFFTPSIKVISFSKYLIFHLGVVIGHANWANLITHAIIPTLSVTIRKSIVPD